jgi:hypothetical protein
MAQKIRAAMAGANASDLLAGLDAYGVVGSRRLSQVCASKEICRYGT